jgi:ectoine hydroxylase-related dioxygenase (phytanoyl-CoA dioxygenase family)
MNAIEPRIGVANRDWFSEAECSIEALEHAIGERRSIDMSFASEVVSGVPLYNCRTFDDQAPGAGLMSEWANVLRYGSGVFVIRHSFEDLSVIDAATAVFESIIKREKAHGNQGADHFANAGSNDRIWNAQEKLCIEAPEVFARYFSNRLVDAVSQAWLGPAYQMTSQVNVVRPGGKAQQVHRDYHLGFQTADVAARYPAHVHEMSPFLTLQGAVAHSDMPIESGPTKLLPFSQLYLPGYLAWRRQDFRDYFEAHFVQVPLLKGDLLFFNPALFHAAGSNQTVDVQRMANLIQVSSAYGRAMETVDRTRMCEAVYPVLTKHRADGAHDGIDPDIVIASCAEGYAFPTNLDRDPPTNGLAPQSQQALLRQALDEAWSPDTLHERLHRAQWRRDVSASSF